MPAFSVDLSADMLAQMGEFKAAAREMEREWADTQRRITKDLRAGQSAKPEDVERAQHLEEKRDYYMGQARARARQSDDPATALDYDLAPSRRDNSPFRGLAKEMVENSRRQMEAAGIVEPEESGGGSRYPTLDKMYSAVNMHSPHGRLRTLLNGRMNATMLQDIGGLAESAGETVGSSTIASAGASWAKTAAGMAGPIGLVGMTAREVFKQFQEKADSEKTAAEIDLARESINFDYAHKQRFNMSDQMTAQMQARANTIASTYKGASNSGVLATAVAAYTSGDYTNLIGAGFEAVDNWKYGAERKAKWDKNQQSIYDTIHGTPGSPRNLQAYRNPDALGDWHSYINSAAVQHSQDYTDLGFFGWIKSKTVGKITGSRERELREFAQETAKKRVEALSAELKRQQDEYDADPHNKLNDRERDHHMRIVEEAHVKHFQNWSPI